MNYSARINELAIAATGGTKPFAVQTVKYIKGPRKGQRKDYWLINDAKFMELWNTILPYIMKSSNRSSYYADSMEREDLVSVIQMRLLICLRNYGPRPQNQPFSKYLPLFVNNILTNGFGKTLREKSRINYEAISLFDQVYDGDNPTTLAAVTADTNTDYSREESDLVAHLCEHDQKIVLYYLQTENKSQTAKAFGISYHELQKTLRKCIEGNEGQQSAEKELQH